MQAIEKFLYGLMISLGVSIFINLMLIVVIAMTPAWTFFIARIMRKPVIITHSQDNMSEIKAGSRIIADWSTVPKLGPFHLPKGSGTWEPKAKVRLYNVLTTQSEAQNLLKAALMDAARQEGHKLFGWKDMEMVFRALKDDEWVKSTYQYMHQKRPAKANDFKSWVKKVRGDSLLVLNHTAYKFNELYNMFPNNFNPVNVETSNQLAVARANKGNFTMTIVWFTGIFLILLGAAIAYMMIKNGTPPQIIVKMAENGANATSAWVQS
jgi:hypothetical protein